MASLPPWHRLKQKSKEKNEITPMCAEYEWYLPPLVLLEKHVRSYRDLLRSTEKVELTLSHSGKREVMESTDEPGEPPKPMQEPASKHYVINVDLRTERDPRFVFVTKSGDIHTYPEYEDPTYLVELLRRRAAGATPGGSKALTPIGSPRSNKGRSEAGFKKPAPPPGQPVKPPPPPKAPPGPPPEKRIRY
jgi:hypothetical protein